MNLNEYLDRVTEDVVNPILEYMAMCAEDDGEFEDFSTENVDECAKLLTEYLTALAELGTPSDEEIMSLVENVVLGLNELNEQTTGRNHLPIASMFCASYRNTSESQLGSQLVIL